MGGIGLYFPNGEYPNLSVSYPKILIVPPNSYRCANLCTIYTDSEYTINALTRYCDIWIKNGWRKTNGKSVKNIDLLKPMHYMYNTNANVNFQFVRAHTGLLDKHSLNNNIADAFARKGAATQS
jgi:ribonuclease HI